MHTASGRSAVVVAVGVAKNKKEKVTCRECDKEYSTMEFGSVLNVCGAIGALSVLVMNLKH